MRAIIYFVASLWPVLPIGICDMLTEFPGTAWGWGCQLRAGCSALQAALTHRCDAQSPRVLCAQAPFKFLSMEVELATRRSQTLLRLIFKSSVRRTGSEGQGLSGGCSSHPRYDAVRTMLSAHFPEKQNTRWSLQTQLPSHQPPTASPGASSEISGAWTGLAQPRTH